jgi:hypothetical protein
VKALLFYKKVRHDYLARLSKLQERILSFYVFLPIGQLRVRQPTADTKERVKELHDGARVRTENSTAAVKIEQPASEDHTH